MLIISRIKIAIKYWGQRRYKGWDDSETWGLDTTLAFWIVPRLKRFKEVTNGYPAGLTEEKWYEILDKMIRAFEIVVKENEEGEITEEEWSEFKEGFKLFHDHYRSLWW